jgi:hypothetical protein
MAIGDAKDEMEGGDILTLSGPMDLSSLEAAGAPGWP